MIQEFKIKGIDYRPNYVPTGIPKSGTRRSGPAYMNLAAVVNPSRPYKPIYRMGKSQMKSQITLKKH